MPLIATDTSGSDLPPCPAGVHVAVCDLIADMGMILNRQSGKEQRKIFIRWQIPSQRVEWEDKKTGEIHNGPQRIGSRYTLSLSERALLYRDLVNWRGIPFTEAERKSFDVFRVLGAGCLIQVTHKPDAQRPGKVFANVSAIMRLPNGYERPNPDGPLVKYSDDEREQFELLPKWLQAHIGMQQQAAATPSFVNDPSDPFADFNRANGAAATDPSSPNYVARGAAMMNPGVRPPPQMPANLTPEQIAAAAAYLAAANGEPPSRTPPRSLQQAAATHVDANDPDAWRSSDSDFDRDIDDDIPF